MESGRCVSVSLLLLFCFNVLQYSFGLKCYACQWMDGRGDRECLNNPPPSRYLTECNQPQCWKKTASYNGMQNVQRFCSASSYEKSFCQQSTFENLVRGDGYPATECFCRTEGCNGSSKLLAFNQFPNYGVLITTLIASSVMLVSRRFGADQVQLF